MCGGVGRVRVFSLLPVLRIMVVVDVDRLTDEQRRQEREDERLNERDE